MQVIVTMKSGRIVKNSNITFDEAWITACQDAEEQLGDKFNEEIVIEQLIEYVQGLVDPIMKEGVKNLDGFFVENENGTHYFNVENIDFVTFSGLEEFLEAAMEKAKEIENAE